MFRFVFTVDRQDRQPDPLKLLARHTWLRPFNYLGATTVTTLNRGGTDHMAFDALGLPGFEFIQDPLNYSSKVHHSNLDVYEEANPGRLEAGSAILATFVYHAAMRDAMLPRKPLPKPRADAR